MDAWKKIKIFYRTMLGSPGSTLTVTSTLSGTDVANIYNMLEVGRWEATSAATQIITFDAGAGEIANGDFETGDTSGWGISLGGTASATFSASTAYVHEGAYSGYVAITDGGTAPVHVNIWQTGLKLVKGRRYTLIFAARTPANPTRTVYVEVIDPVSLATYTVEGLQTVTIDNTWQVYKVSWTASVTTDNAGVRWLLGGSTVDFVIDYVSFGEERFYTADYLAVSGHNLATAEAQVKIKYSDDGATWFDAYDATVEYPKTDGIYLKEWTSPGPYRHWRLELVSPSVPPRMTVAIWGTSTELDHATASFDPHAQEVQANVNLTQGGYVAGIHSQYTERRMTLTFHDADAALYDRIREWWDISGLKPFFISWEPGDNAEDVYLMRPDFVFKNPLKDGGLYRDIKLTLRGRKE